jgi:hypothetical protein
MPYTVVVHSDSNPLLVANVLAPVSSAAPFWSLKLRARIGLATPMITWHS